ncbi:MAG: hypothetical protein KME46_14555 [Brasilonema angustatum HA4187-MV1]|jgi:hypothetical protein|nr:hypothetical protein [Brasilonema angustatum HA4187-MV1]
MRVLVENEGTDRWLIGKIHSADVTNCKNCMILLNEKIVCLRTARIIETDAAILFRLDKQIEEAQTEHDKIAQQIDSLDKALEQGY